jgi:hypothetical protein
MKLNLGFKILIFLIALTAGCVVSQYTFNEIDPWVGLISYGVVAVLSIYFIINQIKKFI